MTILCVGIACLDIIQVCSSYPHEDSKTRSEDQWWQRGGNASNSCTVLSQLGAKCEFLGTLGTKQNARFVLDDFEAHGISTQHCVVHEDCDTPMSTVIVSSSTGSRTVVNSNKNLPELGLEDFASLDLSQYSWIHFEGRNVGTVAEMIEHCVRWRSDGTSPGSAALCISVELEKPRVNPDISVILPMADVVFVGKDFAHSQGWGGIHETFEAISEHTKPGATVIVPWGEQGAAARGPDGMVVESPAFPPPRVVDTLAAGDTFIAATIFSLQSGRTLQDSITLGCRVAGAKVGQYGLSHLKQTFQDLCGSSCQAQTTNEHSHVVI